MSARLALIVASLITVGIAGCQCGPMNCGTTSCGTAPGILPHSVMHSANECGCGMESCSTCRGLVSVRHGGCEGCGSMSCGGCGAYGPIQHLRQLTRQSICGTGCGEIYWGEWRSDPPACCDPCDSWGGYTGFGGYCGSRSPLAVLWSNIIGQRHGGGCGCADCTSGYDIYSEPNIGLPPSGGQMDEPGPVPGSSVQIQPRRSRTTIRQTAARPLADPQPLGTGVRRAGYSRR